MSDPEPFKVIDRRGAPKEERKPTSPDLVTDIRETDDPMVFIAVLPGNRVPEQPFKVSRLEAHGFKLLAKRSKGYGPDGQRAAHAARMKVLKVIEKAMKVHNGADVPGMNTTVLGPRLVQ